VRNDRQGQRREQQRVENVFHGSSLPFRRRV
jgi:hypothetical protein